MEFFCKAQQAKESRRIRVNLHFFEGSFPENLHFFEDKAVFPDLTRQIVGFVISLNHFIKPDRTIRSVRLSSFAERYTLPLISLCPKWTQAFSIFILKFN